MHKWKAIWRLDHEETFMTDSFVYELLTMDLIQAAIQIVRDGGGHNTLISLERVDV